MTDQPVDPATAESMANAADNANLPTTSGDLQPQAADQPVETIEDVPDQAADVVTWLQEAPTPGVAAARADLAEQAENDRSGDNRTTVTDAINAARST